MADTHANHARSGRGPLRSRSASTRPAKMGSVVEREDSDASFASPLTKSSGGTYAGLVTLLAVAARLATDDLSRWTVLALTAVVVAFLVTFAYWLVSPQRLVTRVIVVVGLCALGALFWHIFTGVNDGHLLSVSVHGGGALWIGDLLHGH